MRRIVDLVFALSCLILTLPIMLVISVLIRIESSGPIFYRQQMVGWNGKLFSLFRFRTMFSDAVKGDPEMRFTRVGRFIRNYSLDHLPQLLNLLKGDLTLIGPRPMEAGLVDLHDLIWKQYVQFKPGLFNYAVYKLGKEWTPSRATNPTLNQELELQYGEQRSVVSDLQLFLQSLRMFFASKGNIKARGDVDPELAQRMQDDNT